MVEHEHFNQQRVVQYYADIRNTLKFMVLFFSFCTFDSKKKIFCFVIFGSVLLNYD